MTIFALVSIRRNKRISHLSTRMRFTENNTNTTRLTYPIGRLNDAVPTITIPILTLPSFSYTT